MAAYSVTHIRLDYNLFIETLKFKGKRVAKRKKSKTNDISFLNENVKC